MPLVTRDSTQASLFIGTTTPTANSAGDLWQDTSTSLATLKEWNGSTWTAKITGVSPDTAVLAQSTTITDYTQPTTATSSSNGSTDSNITITSTSWTGGSISNQSNASDGDFNTNAYIAGNDNSSFTWNFASTTVKTVRVKFDHYCAAGGTWTLSHSGGTYATGSISTTLWGTVDRTDTLNVTSSFIKLTLTTGSGGSWTFQQPYDITAVQTTTSAATNATDNNTATKWFSNAETNPRIYVDMGSSVNCCAIALYYDGTTTTETQIKIQTSPDASTWTDKRTINTSALTNGAWNYIRFNITTARYVRVYGNSGTSKVLSIYEAKVYKATDSVVAVSSGRLNISSSDTSLSLAGT